MKTRDKLIEYTFSLDSMVSIKVPWGTSDQIVEEKALNKFKDMLNNNQGEILLEDVMSVAPDYEESEVE